MPTPAKPYLVLAEENKSHRTKAELNRRKKAEESFATGVELKERSEVESNPVAHKEFKRLTKLLKGIKKNDAIYEIIINRYCILVAECRDLEAKREKIYETAERLEKKLEELGSHADFNDLRAAISGIAEIYGTMIACDKQLQTKRKMLLDIEKENIMTIAAALRNIPKKEDKANSKILEALNGGKGQ